MPSSSRQPRLRFLVLALALATGLPNAFAKTEPAPIRVDIPYEQFTLPNGLRVVVHTDRKAPIVGITLYYRVGSKHEPKGKTGFAHLFEHLMFNGSEHFNDDWFKALEKLGATDMNGTIDSTLPVEAERALIFETLSRLQACGIHPDGWLSIARSQSFATPDLLAETGYGYLETDPTRAVDGIVPVTRFVEKPDLAQDTIAARWFRKSAEQLYPNGLLALGLCYRHGRGVPKDPIEGLAWIAIGGDHSVS